MRVLQMREGTEGIADEQAHQRSPSRVSNDQGYYANWFL